MLQQAFKFDDSSGSVLQSIVGHEIPVTNLSDPTSKTSLVYLIAIIDYVTAAILLMQRSPQFLLARQADTGIYNVSPSTRTRIQIKMLLQVQNEIFTFEIDSSRLYTGMLKHICFSVPLPETSNQIKNKLAAICHCWHF